jgi:hypothetical protein
MTQLRIEVLHIEAKEYLDQIRRLPDSRKKAYKLLTVRGSNKVMIAAAREYARLVAKGYRL